MLCYNLYGLFFFLIMLFSLLLFFLLLLVLLLLFHFVLFVRLRGLWLLYRGLRWQTRWCFCPSQTQTWFEMVEHRQCISHPFRVPLTRWLTTLIPSNTLGSFVYLLHCLWPCHGWAWWRVNDTNTLTALTQSRKCLPLWICARDERGKARVCRRIGGQRRWWGKLGSMCVLM